MDDLSLRSPPAFLFLVAGATFPFFTSVKLSSNPPAPTGKTQGLLLLHFWQKASIRRDGRLGFRFFMPSLASQLITIFSILRGRETTCVPLSRLVVKISRWVKHDERRGGGTLGWESIPVCSNLGMKLAIGLKTSGDGEKKAKIFKYND